MTTIRIILRGLTFFSLLFTATYAASPLPTIISASCPTLRICYAIDESASVGTIAYASQISAIVNLTSQFDTLSPFSQFSAIAFTNVTEVISKLKKDSTAFIALLETRQRKTGTTDIAKGLQACGNILSTVENPRVVVLITDGVGGDPVPVATLLKDDGYYIITVGITNAVNRDILKAVASSESFYTHINSFREFSNNLPSILNDLCQVSPETTKPTPELTLPPSPSASPSLSASATSYVSSIPKISTTSIPTSSSTPSQSSWPSPSASITSSSTPTQSPTSSESSSPTASNTPTISASPSESISPTASSTPTLSPTISESTSREASNSSTLSPTISESGSPTASTTPKLSSTASKTNSPKPSNTASESPSSSESSSAKASKTPRTSPTTSQSRSPTVSHTPTLSPTSSSSTTSTVSNSQTISPTSTISSPSASVTPTITTLISSTPSSSVLTSPTVSNTPSISISISPSVSTPPDQSSSVIDFSSPLPSFTPLGQPRITNLPDLPDFNDDNLNIDESSETLGLNVEYFIWEGLRDEGGDTALSTRTSVLDYTPFRPPKDFPGELASRFFLNITSIRVDGCPVSFCAARVEVWTKERAKWKVINRALTKLRKRDGFQSYFSRDRSHYLVNRIKRSNRWSIVIPYVDAGDF